MTRRVLTAAMVAVLAPTLVGCGGGGKNSAQPLPPTPTLTVPGQNATPSVPKASTGDTGTTGPTTQTAVATTPTSTTQSNPTTPQGGAAAPQTGGASPDSPSNNTSPPAGSPAQRFEQFCKDNPGAC